MSRAARHAQRKTPEAHDEAVMDEHTGLHRISRTEENEEAGGTDAPPDKLTERDREFIRWLVREVLRSWR